MPKFVLNIIPALLLWGGFSLVILQMPYPHSLTQASLMQLIAFFIPLYLALVLTLNLIIDNIFSSLSIGLGLIFFLILKALGSLNAVTGVLIIVTVALLVSYFRKVKKRRLTKLPKIPKLTRLQRTRNKVH